jgi:hypothetical protein
MIVNSWLQFHPPSVARAPGAHPPTTTKPRSPVSKRFYDGAVSSPARLLDSFHCGLAMLSFGLERKVNHHDGVFLDDTDQQE